MCEDSAFVNTEDFKIDKLTSKDDKEFHQWANKIITQQPTLLGAYSDLRECWDYYHGTTRTTK